MEDVALIERFSRARRPGDEELLDEMLCRVEDVRIWLEDLEQQLENWPPKPPSPELLASLRLIDSHFAGRREPPSPTR